MTSQTLVHVLIVLLLIIANSRFIFIRNVHNDSLSTFPFLAFLISTLNTFAYGFSHMELLLITLSFFVSIWNFRSLLRFLSKLVVDHYGLAFKLISIFNLLLSLFAGFLVFYFKPVKPDAKKFMISEQKLNLAGTFETGFHESDSIFYRTSCRFYKFTSSHGKDTFIKYSPYNPIEYTEKPVLPEKIVLLMPSKAASVEDYKSIAYKLAYDGYTVYSAEFFSKDMKWLKGIRNTTIGREHGFQDLKLRTPEKYDTIIRYSTDRLCREFEELYRLASPSSSSEVYLAADYDIAGAMNEFIKRYPYSVRDTFDFASVADYESKGYGPVENTDPLFAYMIDLEPERLGYMSSHLASAVERRFNSGN